MLSWTTLLSYLKARASPGDDKTNIPDRPKPACLSSMMGALPVAADVEPKRITKMTSDVCKSSKAHSYRRLRRVLPKLRRMSSVQYHTVGSQQTPPRTLHQDTSISARAKPVLLRGTQGRSSCDTSGRLSR